MDNEGGLGLQTEVLILHVDTVAYTQQIQRELANSIHPMRSIIKAV